MEFRKPASSLPALACICSLHLNKLPDIPGLTFPLCKMGLIVLIFPNAQSCPDTSVRRAALKCFMKRRVFHGKGVRHVASGAIPPGFKLLALPGFKLCLCLGSNSGSASWANCLASLCLSFLSANQNSWSYCRD